MVFTFLDDLHSRGIIENKTSNIDFFSSNNKVKAYLGIDPTAKSLHVGHLVPLLILFRLQQYGHTPFLLIGGATGMIGDPSFKSQERVFLENKDIEENKTCIKKQINDIIKLNSKEEIHIVDNKDWYSEMSIINFLREAGKHITVSYMLAKDSVKRRINNNLSFTEFSYQVLQSYDFYYLYKKYGVNLQIGGGDQWGNITTGIDFIRKKCGEEVHGFTIKLLTKKDGAKFGKTEKGNIWLDKTLTLPYDFYQFWINMSDDEAENIIKIFSSKSIEQINTLISDHCADKEKRILQKEIAHEMTAFVHGEKIYNDIIMVTNILFNSEFKISENVNFRAILENIAHVSILTSRFNVYDTIYDMLSDLCVPELFSSKSEIKRTLVDNIISINKEKYSLSDKVENIKLIQNCALIQRGKKHFYAIIVE